MNLISDLGGQLGLWLGLSAITIGELCSLLFTVGRSMTSTWFADPETSDVRFDLLIGNFYNACKEKPAFCVVPCFLLYLVVPIYTFSLFP